MRIPEPGRFEFRLMDGACNPYLTPAALLAAGLDGIANKRDPGKRLDIDMYAEPHKAGDAKKLPLNLLDALRATAGNQVLIEALGKGPIESYTKLKTREWNASMPHLSQWKRERTLDC